MFNEKLYADVPVTDSEGRIRMDDLEMGEEIQSEVHKLWTEIATDNLSTHADLEGYNEDFYKLFGFGAEGVDYEADTDQGTKIPSIEE